MGRIDGFGIGVVVSNDGKDRATGNICFEHLVDGRFGIRGVVSRKLVLFVMGDDVASEDTPGEHFVTGLVVM